MKRTLKGKALKQAILNDDPTPQVYDNELLVKGQLMELFHVTERTLYNWRKKGILPFAKVGGCIYYKLGDLRKLSQTHFWDNHLL